MTYEEVINILDRCCVGDCDLCNNNKKHGGKCDGSEYAFLAIKTAIEALEKQIPKKPIKKTNFGSDILDGKYCPCCDSMFDRTTMFCDNCGQALDWSEEE